MPVSSAQGKTASVMPHPPSVPESRYAHDSGRRRMRAGYIRAMNQIDQTPNPGTGSTTESGSYHYGVIRRAIEEIDAGGEDLSLDELAARMGMSAAHFQRVFSAWAGVSPKRYQQYLRLGYAKELLRGNQATLEVAQAVGLSGSGRLHDLFLRWEAMTPGDYARKGAGLVIRYGWVESPFGDALLMASDRGLCAIGFAGDSGREAIAANLAGRWPEARFHADPGAIVPLAQAVFGGRGEIRLQLIGAPFQIKVWEALLTLPPGEVTTYSEVARAIGNPRAVRAVGSAIGRNPLSWLIPCHRVLRKSGALGGYEWGLPLKRAMLAFEGARHDAASPQALPGSDSPRSGISPLEPAPRSHAIEKG